MEKRRLDKLLGDSGLYSRKDAKALIRRGKVLVGGVAARAGDQKVSFGEPVTVDGVPIRNQPHLYIMMNKPAGVLSATRDRNGKTALELLPPELRRKGLFPAGRLDKDTEGFLLITDDGAFAHRILSPKSHVPKTYLCTLDKPFDFQAVQSAFASGLQLGGGDVCSPAQLTLWKNAQNPQVEIVIFEGMFHQIKRMFVQFSLEVVYLKRVKIGGLELDENLPIGGSKEILHKDFLKIC